MCSLASQGYPSLVYYLPGGVVSEYTGRRKLDRLKAFAEKASAKTMPQIPSYYHHHSLDGHSRPINCVQFSQDGRFLASGADDGYILIWLPSKGKLLQKISGKQGPILVLKWLSYPHLLQSHFFISGGADGTIKLWKQTESMAKFHFAGMYTISEGAIEDMAWEESHIAIVGTGRISLLSIDVNHHNSPFKLVLTEPGAGEPHLPALARSVHFFNSGKSLLVGFLDTKEIIAWTISPWVKIWRQKLATRIGNMAWSSTTETLLVWNLANGLDVYRLADKPIRTGMLKLKIKQNFVIQVAFGGQGKYAISGSDNGEVYLWDFESTQPTQILSGDSDTRVIQTVTHHEVQHDKSYIASASSDPYDTHPTINIWATVKPKTTTQPPPRPNRMPSLTWVFGILQGLSLLFIFAWFSGSLPLH